MAISFDSVTSATITLGTNTWPSAHTCAGTNRYVFVAFDDGQSSTVNNITNVTYDGVAMTKIRENPNVSNGVDILSVWGLSNPNTTANATISWSSTTNATQGVFCTSYTGVNQNSTPDNSSGATATGSGGAASPLSISITPVASSWVVLFTNANAALTAATNLTTRMASNSFGNYTGDSNANATGGSSFTQTASYSGNTQWSAIQVSITTPVVAVANGNFLRFM